jgi:YVTN family beta-propeller protein
MVGTSQSIPISIPLSLSGAISTTDIDTNPITVNQDTNAVYVGSARSDSLTIIDGVTKKVVAGVTLDINPSNSGRIICDTKDAPIKQYFYLFSGTTCTAIPNKGFEFSSWVENLQPNSTRTIRVSKGSDSLLTPLLIDFGIIPQDNESTINAQFGSYTANFKALPSPIPPEYVATLFTVVATAFIGSWLTPTVIGWRNARKQGNKLDHYHNEIKKVYNDSKINRTDIQELDNLRDNITDEYTRGKINKESYDKLVDEISISYAEIITKEIDSLNSLSEIDKVKRLSTIIDDIDDMLKER